MSQSNGTTRLQQSTSHRPFQIGLRTLFLIVTAGAMVVALIAIAVRAVTRPEPPISVSDMPELQEPITIVGGTGYLDGGSYDIALRDSQGIFVGLLVYAPVFPDEDRESGLYIVIKSGPERRCLPGSAAEARVKEYLEQAILHADPAFPEEPFAYRVGDHVEPEGLSNAKWLYHGLQARSR